MDSGTTRGCRTPRSTRPARGAPTGACTRGRRGARAGQPLRRRRTCRADDERVDLIDVEVEEFGDFLTLHNFYVRFLLPMMVEVQLWEWGEGCAPEPR